MLIINLEVVFVVSGMFPDTVRRGGQRISVIPKTKSVKVNTPRALTLKK